MSALLNRPLPSITEGNRGFSLLEMLTVLFIIGAAAALVTPNLPLLVDRITYASERDTIIREINSLPYRAIDGNQDLLLSEPSLVQGDKVSRSLIDDQGNGLDELRLQAPYRSSSIGPAMLTVPEDWTIEIAEPVHYRASGFCSGGEITLIAGALRYELKLLPPYCQISGQDL